MADIWGARGPLRSLDKGSASAARPLTAAAAAAAAVAAAAAAAAAAARTLGAVAPPILPATCPGMPMAAAL